MIGFIGVGNMAGAIINGMLGNGVDCKDIYIHNTTKTKMIPYEKKGINICSSNGEVVEKSKYVFIAVKPNVYPLILEEIKDKLSEKHIIVTMASGFSIENVKEIIGGVKVCRTMPNTPALVGAGYTAVCFDNLISDDEKEELIKLIRSFGEAEVISESYLNAYSAVSGSGPAFAFMMMEAMADAAVLLGVPRKEAYKAVELTLLGSAKLAVESGKHPGELKDMVCSPGGTTIEGVRTLEEKGFRSAMIESILNTYKKNLNLKNIR